MIRSTWSGMLTFGLVTVPIRLFAATESKDLHFHQLHHGCNGRIEYKKICAVDGLEIPLDDIDRGYEYEPGEYVIVTEEILNTVLPIKAIEVEEFIPLSEIDPLVLEKSYYMEPQKGAERPYALFYRAMEKSKQCAVGRMVMRTKQYTVLIRPVNGALTMTTILWPDEVRSPEGLTGASQALELRLDAKQLELALNLIKVLSKPKFDHSRFPNTWRDEVAARLVAQAQAQKKGKKLSPVKAVKTATEQGQDIMASLQATVAAAMATNKATVERPRIARRKSA